MAPQDTIFLCLVFCLGQRIQAQEGFPTPTISATPSSTIPWNGSVRILCHGTPESFQYQLSMVENSTLKVVETKLGFRKEAEFIINHLNTTTAGCYQCRYRKQFRWSEQSKTLELMVTGLYDRPVLSTNQSLVLMPGENISFQCHSEHSPFDRFSLAKEGEASLSQPLHGERHSKFALGPVTPDSTGIYRCYGWYSSSPYVWSAPSDSLELTVAGSKKQDYRMENSIRMAMAGLILVGLLVILAENWHGQEASHQEDWHNLAAQSWSQQECKTLVASCEPWKPQAGMHLAKQEESAERLDPPADCCPLHMKCCTQAHVLDYLVPTWYHCLERCVEPSRCGLCRTLGASL